MRTLLITLAVFLLVGVSQINAAEAKSLYDLYRAERISLGLKPLIVYADEPIPKDFETYAFINKDYRDSIDLMLQIMQDTPAQKDTPFWETKEFGFVAGTVTTILVMHAVK